MEDIDLAFKVTAGGHDIAEVNGDLRGASDGETPHEGDILSPEFQDRLSQEEFRKRLHREIGLDGQLYDRLAQVEQVLSQTLPDVPDHLSRRVTEMVERDKERRRKLRVQYLEEAEEYRDNGDQPEREIFLNLAEWVMRGVGSIRQHSQLLDEFNSAREEYNEIRRNDDD